MNGKMYLTNLLTLPSIRYRHLQGGEGVCDEHILRFTEINALCQSESQRTRHTTSLLVSFELLSEQLAFRLVKVVALSKGLLIESIFPDTQT